MIAYDARGHGRSSPAPAPEAYTYADLGEDLIAVLDDRGIDRAVLAGASMGAHTLLWVALHAPERVAGLVVITPAYDPAVNEDAARLARWDALADGLERGGVEGFIAAYGVPNVPEALRETVLKVTRQRLSHHEHPEAVADALRAVPRSRPFDDGRRAGRDRGAGRGRGERRRARSRPSPGGGGGLRRGNPRRAAGARRAGYARRSPGRGASSPS